MARKNYTELFRRACGPPAGMSMGFGMSCAGYVRAELGGEQAGAPVADGAGWVVGAQSPVEEKACATAAPVVAASPTTSTSAPAAVEWRANRPASAAASSIR